MSPRAPEPPPLATLLRALDEDSDRAAEILLELRRKLTTMFEGRGFADAPELVDRTFDRAARKAAEGADLSHRPFPFFYGIARFIALEASRQQRRWAKQEQLAAMHAADPLSEEAPRLRCFRDCLKRLPARSRELLWRYFDRPRENQIARRKHLADSLAISDVALRLRVHRLRGRLADCLDRCLAAETDRTHDDSRK